MKNWQRDQIPRKWREKGGEEDRECDGREDCVKRDLERVGREWGTTAKYGSRRLTVDRERSDKNVREEQATVTLARPHP